MSSTHGPMGSISYWSQHSCLFIGYWIQLVSAKVSLFQPGQSLQLHRLQKFARLVNTAKAQLLPWDYPVGDTLPFPAPMGFCFLVSSAFCVSLQWLVLSLSSSALCPQLTWHTHQGTKGALQPLSFGRKMEEGSLLQKREWESIRGPSVLSWAVLSNCYNILPVTMPYILKPSHLQ